MLNGIKIDNSSEGGVRTTKIHHFPELWEMMLPENITKENLLDELDIENLVSIILMTNI